MATFTRQDVWSLQVAPPWDPVTLAYAKAVRTMQGRDRTDPTSWDYQSAMHGTYATVIKGADWNQCQHAQWFFLPWHRMYVYFFERIVRAAVIADGGPDDWALPYWNYDQPFPRNTLPPPFREPTLPDGSANPLYITSPHRAAAYMAGAQLSPAITSSAVAMDANHQNFSTTNGTNFGGGPSPAAHFGSATGQLEQQPHNVIHVAIGGRGMGRCEGGFMTDPNCAASDPIFWLHHSNIDRLWVYWLSLGGKRADPTDSKWLGQSFPFYDEKGNPASLTCADVVDTAALGYTYT
jgi:hypothetical protein